MTTKQPGPKPVKHPKDGDKFCCCWQCRWLGRTADDTTQDLQQANSFAQFSVYGVLQQAKEKGYL